LGYDVIALSSGRSVQINEKLSDGLNFFDFNHVEDIERCANYLLELKPDILINNAGMMPRIVPLSKAEHHDLTKALRVSLEAPMLLCAAFLSATEGWLKPRKILNVSSGLGHRAMASQAGYCASKAGMDQFTRCLAIEESFKDNGAKVCSLSPGIIDTDMQVQLRSASNADFPDHGYFVDHQQKGSLVSANETAQKVLHFLSLPQFGDAPVADIRDV
jgi:NAD(P)-dependent dehydrogenase (short-subunit alcohol dehydrogenase family)